VYTKYKPTVFIFTVTMASSTLVLFVQLSYGLCTALPSCTASTLLYIATGRRAREAWYGILGFNVPLDTV